MCPTIAIFTNAMTFLWPSSISFPISITSRIFVPILRWYSLDYTVWRCKHWQFILVFFSALLYYHMIEIGIQPLHIRIILMLRHHHTLQKTLHICKTLYAICISAWPSGRFMRRENLLQVLRGIQAPTHCGRPSSIFFPLHFNKFKGA